jgi:hypothetical protein
MCLSILFLYLRLRVIADVEGNVSFSPFITKTYIKVTPMVEGMRRNMN